MPGYPPSPPALSSLEIGHGRANPSRLGIRGQSASLFQVLRRGWLIHDGCCGQSVRSVTKKWARCQEGGVDGEMALVGSGSVLPRSWTVDCIPCEGLGADAVALLQATCEDGDLPRGAGRVPPGDARTAKEPV